MTIGEIEVQNIEDSPPRSDKRLKCPECGSTNLIPDKEVGELVCGGCGLVVAKVMLDTGEEWRAYTKEDWKKRSRRGGPILFSKHDKGLSTFIGRENSGVASKKKGEMNRLRRLDARSRFHASKDRNLSQAMSELDRLCDKLYIPSKTIIEDAAITYRKALDRGLVKGRSIDGIKVASDKSIKNKKEYAKTQDELAEASGVTSVTVRNLYKKLDRGLGYNTKKLRKLIK
jgi:transcription initiation factor TFIIB